MAVECGVYTQEIMYVNNSRQKKYGINYQKYYNLTVLIIRLLKHLIHKWVLLTYGEILTFTKKNDITPHKNL